MFSQLWANRDAAGIGAEDLPLLKGVYRHGLAHNAGTLASALDASQLLNEAGIPVLFIKGAAMIARTGRLGLRLIDDVDFLIPEADAQRATALLAAAGYEDKHISAAHSWDCITPAGFPLDVHWWAFKTAGNDLCMFEMASGTTILGRTVQIPSATDSLIIAIAHGFRIPFGAPLRWIADAQLMFQLQGEAIDWDVLLERARRPGLALSLIAGLDFLAREFDAPVPVDVLDELRRRPVHWRERGAHWAAVKHRPLGMALATGLLQNRANRLHYGDLSRRGYLAEDLRAVRLEVRRTARAGLIALIRRLNAAPTLARSAAHSRRINL
jgi:hypothetical protein